MVILYMKIEFLVEANNFKLLMPIN